MDSGVVFGRFRRSGCFFPSFPDVLECSSRQNNRSRRGVGGLGCFSWRDPQTVGFGHFGSILESFFTESATKNRSWSFFPGFPAPLDWFSRRNKPSRLVSNGLGWFSWLLLQTTHFAVSKRNELTKTTPQLREIANGLSGNLESAQGHCRCEVYQIWSADFFTE